MRSFLQSFLRRNINLILAAIILFAAGYLLKLYLRSNVSTQLLTGSVESFLQSRERDFTSLAANKPLLARLSAESYSQQELDELVAKQYGILLYQLNPGTATIQLRFWSDQRSVLPASYLDSPDGNFYVQLTNGQYELIKRSWMSVDSVKMILVGLIPIRYQYYISPENMKPQFVGIADAENRVRISLQQTPFAVKSIYGNRPLFYLERIESYNAAKYSLLLLLLIGSSILLALVIIHNMARSIAANFGRFTGIAFLFIVILSLRASVYLFPDFFNLRQYELFDPSIYGSNYVLSSLGDLLINTILSGWIILFIRQQIKDYTFPHLRNRWLQWLLTGIVLVALVETTFVFANIVQSLVADARISFNVTNFFSLTIYSFVGFFVLAALAFSYFFFSQILLKLIYDFIRPKTLIAYIILAFAGLSLLTFNHKYQVVELDIFVLIWLLVYVWLMMQGFFSGLHFQLNASEVLFWLFVFSISISAIIISENSKIEFFQRTGFAERVAEQRDPSTEMLVSMSLNYIDNEFLVNNFSRFRDPASNRLMKDSLISNSISAYGRYHTRIYTYDSLEKPLFNQDPVSFDTLNTVFQMQGKVTGKEDLKYYEKSFNKFTYIFKKVAENERHKPVGYLFILEEPQDYETGNIVPELTGTRRENLPDYSPVYSYAIYNNDNLVYWNNNYPFPTVLTDTRVTKTDYYQVKKGSYDELWHRISNDKIMVIAKKDNSIIEGITLFAWLFSSFLLLGALIWFVSILVQTRLHWSQLREYLQLNIRSQIHTTIISVSLFSFVVIGIATIFFFINRYNRNNQERLSASMKIAVSEFQHKLPSLVQSNGSMQIQQYVPKAQLEKLLDSVAGILSSDINLYSLNGELLVSSNPFVYTKGILNDHMHPLAYYNMHQLHSVEYFNDEVLGRVSYKSIYCPVREGVARTVAYLNIPYFSSEDELHDEISKFLVTIINLNVFIFLIAGTIALFLTNRITSSFTLISEKMQRINLGKTIDVIEWKAKDEIGVLIKEYNKMVTKLEESAIALAKSEREGAWREMARQVAHEIKNPLTPMKLSIQYLQKAINNNAGNVKELTGNVAKTLVEQIDHLSKIAADFSQFANIGNPKNEVFDLNEMLYSLTSLYETTENLLFKWVPAHQRIMVFADKTQINRLFTNLLQNALEACLNKEKRVVSISEELNGESVLVKIADNGEGIPDTMHSKIFMPNFTTKSSGTGLGLAMSKTIIEQAKGKIWFETSVGRGTTFYVELPILRATA